MKSGRERKNKIKALSGKICKVSAYPKRFFSKTGVCTFARQNTHPLMGYPLPHAQKQKSGAHRPVKEAARPIMLGQEKAG